MSFQTKVLTALQMLLGIDAAAGEPGNGDRKTVMLPSILAPYGHGRAGHNATPKPTPANLRKFAETPIARRAINVVKDRIASMDWKIKVRRGYGGVVIPDASARMQSLRHSLEEGRLDEHEKAVQRMKGMAGAFGGMLTIAHFAIDFLVGRR